MPFIKRVANQYLIASEGMNRPSFSRKQRKTKKEAAEMYFFRENSQTIAPPQTCFIINNSRRTNHNQEKIQDEDVHHDDTISCHSFSNYDDISASDAMNKDIVNESGYLDEKVTTVLGDEDIEIPLNDDNSKTISTFSGRRRCNGSYYNKEFKATLSDYKQDLLMDNELEAYLEEARQSGRSPNSGV